MEMHARVLKRAMTDSIAVRRVGTRKRLLSDHNIEDESTQDSVISRNESKQHESLSQNIYRYDSFGAVSFESTEFRKHQSVQTLSIAENTNVIKKTKHFDNNEFISNSNSSSNDENMLSFDRQISSNISDEHGSSNDKSRFISSNEFFAYVHSYRESSINDLLIIDCGNPFRFNERKIKSSILLSVNDKISRKRLASRGIERFLDDKHLKRLNQSRTIIFYDDSIHCPVNNCHNHSFDQCHVSTSMKCLIEQIERYDSTKQIFILQSTFDEFQRQYPQECDVVSIHETPSENQCSTPSFDIDSFPATEVLPGLFLGNGEDAKNRQFLEEKQIQSILNISTHIPCHFIDDHSFNYLQFHCQDNRTENLLQYFDEAIHFIDRNLSNNQSILIHCQAGISRSPSFVIAYLMKTQSKTVEQAYNFIKEKRKIIMPNLNFLAQLQKYQEKLNSTC